MNDRDVRFDAAVGTRVSVDDCPRSPVRELLRSYARDTYVRPKSVYGQDPPEPFDGGIIDCAMGTFESDPSPRVVRALHEFHVEKLSHYTPLADESQLKRAIIGRFAGAGLSEERVFLGHGSFNLLERVIHKFLKPTIMGGVGPQFSEVPSEFAAAGGSYHPFPLVEPDASLPMGALEHGLQTGGWSVLYIDNPNNPLGRAFDLASMERLAGACDRAGVALLVDEAFGDYIDDAASALHLVPRHRSVIVVRSFSKALGLAGERIGYMAMSAELARIYRQVDVPFEPGGVAQTLAREALADPALIEHVRADVRAAKRQIIESLARTTVRVLPTHPDVAIMAIHAPDRDLALELHRRGIIALRGSNFANTHADWDDSYCRLRVVRGERLAVLCRRLQTL